MPPSPHRIVRLPLLALLLATTVAMPAPAQETELSDHAAELKAMQVRFMMRGAHRRANRYQARLRAEALPAPWRMAAVSAVGVRSRPAPTTEPLDPPSVNPVGDTREPAPASTAAIAPNQIVNNRATDVGSGSGQCEVSIGAFGSNVMAAWNDGEGFVPDPDISTQGFGFSTNSGTTWVDGGIPPVTGGIGVWTSDPVIAVNEKTGAFYFAALCEPTGATNGIGVVKGTFSGGAVVWGTPRVAVSGSNSTVIYDKEWLAADSLTGNLYLIYTHFTLSGGFITSDRIDFTRNTNDNTGAWTAPVTLSAGGDAGRVQGPRVAVGPDGDVWTTWNAIGSVTVTDFMRVRKLTNGGTILGTEATAASMYTNFGSGAPGFNRGLGFAFPGLGVDRSTGPRRGRVYLTWNESVNFYNDALGGTPIINESELNDTPATADPFTMGRTLIGTISSTNDLDYWSFAGTQGQTIICEMDSLYTTTLNASFRLFCTDGTTRLAFSETGSGGFNFASGLIVFTLPTTGTYTLRAASLAGTGGYRIKTGLNGAVTERGRDHRDVFTVYSDNGVAWATPVRVNGEAARFDDWLPEVTVASDGNVYVAWYDWRDAVASICGGASMTYLSRSNDGAATWPDGSPITSAQSAWTTANSNIAPNQGDYIALFADQNAVYACWSDGRNNDPDVFMAAVGLAFTPVQVSLASTYAEPGLVRITWHAGEGAGLVATVYRRTGTDDWMPLGEISPDGSGRMEFEDRTVTAGTRYHYRLGLREGGSETFAGEVAIDVPSAAPQALVIQGVSPNPADHHMWVTFSLPTAEPATLELLDVAGRRVREHSVSGMGRQTLDLGSGAPLPTGVYIVRLTQSGKSAVTRVSVVR